MTEERVEFWGEVDEEHLSAQSMEEGIEDFVEKHWPKLPPSFELAGYRRTKLELAGRDIMDRLLEQLDETFQTDNFTEPTPAMIKAADTLAAVIATEYPVGTVEECCRTTIDLRTHAQANYEDEVLAAIKWG